MRELYEEIRKAVARAITALFGENDEITLGDSKINGETIQPHLFSAIYERIKYIANLQDAKPDSKSQIILKFSDGKEKYFDVIFNKARNLYLKVKIELIEGPSESPPQAKCCGGHCADGCIEINGPR